MQIVANTTAKGPDYSDLDTDAAGIEAIRRPSKRGGKLARAFGHSAALYCSPALAHAVASHAQRVA